MMPLKSHYSVKEVFYTVQGEGVHAGRPAVFCRFAGCNGWSGRAKDRASGPFPCSRWCDTDFVGGKRMGDDELIHTILSLFPHRGNRFVVMTGGEPALQLTDTLIRALHKEVALIAIETNGSLALPAAAHELCWLTVSPKTESIVQDKASELKLIFPTIDPGRFSAFKAVWRYLQPLHDANWAKNTEAAVEYVKKNPEWKLSLQTHKYIGIP